MTRTSANRPASFNTSEQFALVRVIRVIRVIRVKQLGALPAPHRLPAFSSFTSRGILERVDTDRIFAIVEDTVVAIPGRTT